jgi:Domain of unknown function (DUF4124)
MARAADRPQLGKSVAGAAILVAALVLTFATARDAWGTTYKWVDEKGVVHYADKMPAEAVNRGHIELDKQGIRIRKTDAALTPDQVRAREAEVERQKQAARDRVESDRRDTALVSTYSREEDIDLARSRALTTIDSQLQSARLYGGQLQKRQQELNERKQTAGAKGVPPAVERELESIDSELAKTNALIEVKKRESLAVAAKYDADKQRYRELSPASRAEEAKMGILSNGQVGGSTVNVVPTSTNK